MTDGPGPSSIKYLHSQDWDKEPSVAGNFTWNANRSQAIEFIERSRENALFVVIERFSK